MLAEAGGFELNQHSQAETPIKIMKAIKATTTTTIIKPLENIS